MKTGSYKFETVHSYSYLDREINCYSNTSVDIKKCVLSAASKFLHGVQRLLKSYLLSRTTKLFMYKVLIRPCKENFGDSTVR